MKEAVPLLDRERPGDWPNGLQECLRRNYDIFFGWETGQANTAQKYDRAIEQLTFALQNYALVGWHCTRLTDTEIAVIRSAGRLLPNAEMLHRRLDTLLSQDLLTHSDAKRLKDKNKANCSNRAGRIWFCFFHPYLAGEYGIRDLLSHWGGEALYNSHDRDPQIGPKLRSIGRPTIIEAQIPISSIGPHSWLPVKVAQRFLVAHGYQTSEANLRHEDAIVMPLSADNVRRIVSFPEPEFVALTRCDDWECRLE